MAVTRTWKGGGNNQASNPNDWGPTGAPKPGEILQIRGPGGPPPTVTFNVQGHALAGDRVIIGTGTGLGVNLTANLHQADMTADMFNSTGIFNLLGGSNLNLQVWTASTAGQDHTTINMTGKNTLTLTDHDSGVNVNLKPGAEWDGTFNMLPFGGVAFGSLTVNGGTFKNTGASVVNNTENAKITSDVIGSGSFTVENAGAAIASLPAASQARMEFAGSVGPNQTIINSGLVVLDKPGQFSGHILLGTLTQPGNSSLPSEIDLHGLANADSYSYKNDMLSIFSHNTVIDRLGLTIQPGHEFSVEKVAGGVSVISILDPTHPPLGLPFHG